MTIDDGTHVPGAVVADVGTALRLLSLDEEWHVVTVAVDDIFAHDVSARPLGVSEHNTTRGTSCPPCVAIDNILGDCDVVTLIAVKTS